MELGGTKEACAWSMGHELRACQQLRRPIFCLMRLRWRQAHAAALHTRTQLTPHTPAHPTACPHAFFSFLGAPSLHELAQILPGFCDT